VHTCTIVRETVVHECAVVLRTCASKCTPIFPIQAPPCALSQLQMHTQVQESFDRPRTRGPTLTKSLRTTICTALPKIEILITMQEDTTTNLTLVDPGSTGSISRNLQISSQTSCKLTMTAGTNEVALWALQLYIVPFPNF
jgi:hypothetical protein